MGRERRRNQGSTRPEDQAEAAQVAGDREHQAHEKSGLSSGTRTSDTAKLSEPGHFPLQIAADLVRPDAQGRDHLTEEKSALEATVIQRIGP